MTTASFDDWMLRCQRAGTPEKPVRLCEVAETVQLQGQPGPIARVAIGRLSKSDPLRFTVLLPPNVSFPSVIRVGLGDKDPAPLELAWRRCLPGTCVGEAEIHDETLKLWRSATEPGRIVFKDSGNRDIVVPLSMKGLAPALDALAKEGI
ncbi:invasion associated locus B family protein [Hyphomicrobiales bacterium BP6-180914]|uniref:Invasion associated locus B family protein n=2 Tax=Lichenifustis flavocetrariae TaxID=2949735 RepID=A0AA41YSZ1_9HYPH|nr:invasion associated locus B family protein [Lichenifustis flavocetrariae]